MIAGVVHLEHVVAEPERLAHRAAERRRRVEHEDAVVVLPEAQLVLGADHPVALDAADLAPS